MLDFRPGRWGRFGNSEANELSRTSVGSKEYMMGGTRRPGRAGQGRAGQGTAVSSREDSWRQTEWGRNW